MKKKIFKGCAIAFVVVLILIIVAVCILPAIIKTVEQNKKNKSINDAEMVGNYILKGISNDTLNEDIKYYLDTDFSYRDDYTLLLADTDEVQEILDSKRFLYAYALNENTVLISEGATFQQITGYIVTNGKEEITDYVDVPEELMYDSNKVTVTKEKDNLYSFYGGL